MEIIFWSSFAIIVYVYVGYPLILMIAAGIVARPVRKRPAEPSVSLIIAAHNESGSIAAKIRNCLTLDYPREKLQILLSLDGPTDDTACVAGNYVTSGIDVIHFERRQGKAAALNAAMRRVSGDIVVFADVRQTIERRALRELVANFADDHVGAVSGELMLLDDSSESESPVGLYWRYEKKIRSLESAVHSVVGATGALYAVRRSLLRPLPVGAILDDVLIPMRVVLSGYRVVFDSAARAYDAISCCPKAEYGRKVRTLTGNYQLLTLMPELLMPLRNPLFVQFVSHKVGRLAVPWMLTALFVSNLFLARYTFFLLTLLLQSLWYVLAFAGHWVSERQTAALQTPEGSREAA